MARTALAREVKDDQALHRVATLASHILHTLRQHDRRYDSERALRTLLTEDGVAFTVADIGPALDLLTSTKRLIRPEVGPHQPRPGWLPEGGTEDGSQPVTEPVEPDLDAIVYSIVEARGRYRSEAELIEWLADAGVECTTADVLAALDRLWKEGRVIRPRVNHGASRPGWAGSGRDDEGQLLSPSGAPLFIRGWAYDDDY